MARRKGEIAARMNEQDYPHIVEMAVPSGGFRSKSDEMVAFHRELGIEARRGRGRNDDGQIYVRFCFTNPAHVDAFRHRFDGARLTYPVRVGD
jgi:hypothetical protein